MGRILLAVLTLMFVNVSQAREDDMLRERRREAAMGSCKIVKLRQDRFAVVGMLGDRQFQRDIYPTEELAFQADARCEWRAMGLQGGRLLHAGARVVKTAFGNTVRFFEAHSAQHEEWARRALNNNTTN